MAKFWPFLMRRFWSSWILLARFDLLDFIQGFAASIWGSTKKRLYQVKPGGIFVEVLNFLRSNL
jgi:hypothetical protein